MVNRQDENFRGYCGLIESGELREGGEIFVAPDLLKNKITELYVGNERASSACAGQSITFSVEHHDAGRGSLVFDKPLGLSSLTLLRTNNMDVFKSLFTKRNYTLKFIAKEVDSTIIEIEHFVDIETEILYVNEIKQNDIGLCKFFLNEKVAFDKFSVNKFTGSFNVDKHRGKTLGAGLIMGKESYGDNLFGKILKSLKKIGIVDNQRVMSMFTGLSGAGKSDSEHY